MIINFIVVVILILHTCVYRCLPVTHELLSIKNRLVIGMVSAVLSMCCAGSAEIFRQRECNSPIQQMIGMQKMIGD